MKKIIPVYFIIFSFITLGVLSSCSFKLRGFYLENIKNTAISIKTSPGVEKKFLQTLTETLHHRGFIITDTNPQAIITIHNAKYIKTIQSLTNTGIADQYLLKLIINYSINNKSNILTITQDYSYAPQNILGNKWQTMAIANNLNSQAAETLTQKLIAVIN